jgi:preprotein translocase subunit SecY
MATWLLQHAANGDEALVGDLIEEYRRRRSDSWYWGQVLMAVVVHGSKAALIVLGVVALYVVAGRFSIPGARADTLTLLASRAADTPFGLVGLLTGGQLFGVTALALGIMPYVTAALIVQAVALAWRVIGRGPEPRREVPVVTWTRSLAILLCVLQATGLALFLERTSAANGGLELVTHPGWTFRITAVLTLTAGTVCLMFISDQISRRRIGNGMFLVFVAGIVGGLFGLLEPLTAGLAPDPLALLRSLVLNVAIVGIVSYGYHRAIAAPLGRA